MRFGLFYEHQLPRPWEEGAEERLLNDALGRAEQSPLPDPSTLVGGVFATPEELDTPHHK